jgi:stage II sporulation protein R
LKTSNTRDNKFRPWECALLAALCVTLLSGLWANAAQARLSDELVRLHVVGASDSDFDQGVKLKVRDAVISYLSPRLEDASGPNEARAVIEDSLENLRAVSENARRLAGSDRSVTAAIETESFPTRDYESFALPAGDYVSLRITLGGGEGKNWWCVVFPPLCTGSVETEEDAFDELSGESSRLIRTEDGEYRLKFRIIEFFQRLKLVFS